jgi:hypothetical protein
VRFRLTFTVDLTSEHEVASEMDAFEKALVLHDAFLHAMRPLNRPGVLLPVASVAPHPHTPPPTQEA